METLSRLESLLNMWKNEKNIKNEPSIAYADIDYNRWVSSYFNTSGESEYWRTKIIKRLEIMIKFINASATDYINESLNMWSELTTLGCTKDDLDPAKYPLSFDLGNHCALCNYSMGIKRAFSTCNVCPVKWSNKTCHTLYSSWLECADSESRKQCASVILEEIKNGRID